MLQSRLRISKQEGMKIQLKNRLKCIKERGLKPQLWILDQYGQVERDFFLFFISDEQILAVQNYHVVANSECRSFQPASLNLRVTLLW